MLADLHGGGDRSNELVVLEYEEIKQQVKFDLIEWVSMNKVNHSIPAPVGLLRAQRRSKIVYGLIEAGKPSSCHARNELANVVPTLWHEHHDVRSPPPKSPIDYLIRHFGMQVLHRLRFPRRRSYRTS